MPAAAVTVKNLDTNLEIKVLTTSNGSYQVPNLPIGNYSVSFAKDGFKSETHTSILVQGDRTTTVGGNLVVGSVSTSVEVTGTPLLNQVDTTSGYVLNSLAITNTPLGTGSFTQLATLSPGLSADFLNTTGSNAGLGNQAIWANGQRDSSNSFSVNGVTADNLFNGKSGSQVSSSRFTLNTGQTSAAGGDTQTNLSVFDAVGQGLPTPPPETLQELRVNAGMYDASQGSKSGAHIEATTKTGTNQLHGDAWEHFQNDVFNAAPFFRNSSTAISAADKVPALHYNRFGAGIGGPIKKDKIFFYLAYQGLRDTDALNGSSSATVPLHLTDDRSAQALSNVALLDFGKTIAPSQINSSALKLMQAKIGNNYLIPTPTITDAATATRLGYDVYLQGPSSSSANQVLANIDYLINAKDRLSEKYIYQDDPSTGPFGGGATYGFPKTLSSGSQAGSLDNTVILSDRMTWEQKFGFIRQRTFSHTDQPMGAQDLGIDAFGSTAFPAITMTTSDNAIRKGLKIGPSGNFSNAGSFQNDFQGFTNLNWVKGRHTIYLGANWDHTQLNIINNNNNTPNISFLDFTTMLAGNVQPTNTNAFLGTSNRYYRANQVGAFAVDNIKLRSNLSVNLGVRFDYDGPLWEKYGRLTNFHPDLYQYDLASDTIINNGLVVAGNNAALHTPGVSDSTLNGRQWGVAPRIGIVWSPSQVKNLVVRAGFGIFYDRGEYFSEFSPSAGSGFNGPFGVTLAPPFIQQINGTATGTLSQPFAGAVVPPVVTSQTLFAGIVPNKAALSNSNNRSYLFGGYDPGNVLPYAESWSFDLQWQPVNSVQISLGYVGNRDLHQVLPIPFNQPGVATASNPIHGETTSYGYNVLPSETAKTFDGGNTDYRTPYLGLSNNSVFYKAEGIANYNALQLGVRKQLSHGLLINASYTWSHTLDEQSGLGLFFNGNDPSNPRDSYGTSSYDRTHVLSIQYYYQLPKAGSDHSLLGKIGNGWAVSGVTVLQSGLPYSVYDYSGAVAGLYYSQYVSILDPLLSIKPGMTVSQIQMQGTTGIDPNKPLLNASAFYVPTLAPGTNGIPPCTTVSGNQVCDNVETGFSNQGRNIFRGPFQERFDVSAVKQTKIGERFSLKFEADVFNVFNHPSFDAPNNSSSLYSGNPPTVRSFATSFGYIQHTLGSPRIMQMSLNLVF